MQPPTLTQAELMQQVSAMMDARDNRLEAMLHQTMQHVMTMAAGGSDGLPRDGEAPLSPDSDMGFQQVYDNEL